MKQSDILVAAAAMPRLPSLTMGRRTATLLCLVLGLLGALTLAVVTPPFQVPDEGQHFYRAYQISEGSLWGTAQAGGAGAVLPSTLPELVEHFLGTRANNAARPITPQPLTATLDELAKPLDPHRREFLAFARYSPLGYLPQAAAIAVGRLAGAGPLMLFYLARLANSVVSILLLSWAVWLMPVRRDVTLLVALLPMALTEYGSVSPDASVIACAFLVTAIALRCQLTGNMSLASAIVLTFAGTVLCTVKPPYAPLLLVGLSAVLRRQQAGRLIALHAAILAVVIGFTAAWFATALPIGVPTPQSNPAEQWQFITGHPLQYLIIVARTYVSHRGIFLYLSCVGILGWLTLKLPKFVYALPLIGIVTCAIGAPEEDRRLDWWSIAWNTLLVAGMFLVIVTALYIAWTPVAGRVVGGVQGRYLLPILPLAGATFCSALRIPRFRYASALPPSIIVPLLIIIEMITTEVVVARAFAVF